MFGDVQTDFPSEVHHVFKSAGPNVQPGLRNEEFAARLEAGVNCR
jgi:hypothetical protein